MSNSVRVYRYICEILQLYVPGAGHLTPCSVPRGGFLYTVIVPGEGFLLPSSRVPEGWVWMKLIPALLCKIPSQIFLYCHQVTSGDNNDLPGK